MHSFGKPSNTNYSPICVVISEDLLTDPDAPGRDYAFTEHSGGWAIRDARYKLIESTNGNQDLYDLQNDPAEQIDLLAGNTDVSAILSELEAEADRIRN